MKSEYMDVVKRVRGLNSVSTLKKWRKKAEDLAGVSFNEENVKTSRHSSTRTFLFSEDEVQKFQQVADTKAEHGLDQAILRAFTSDSESPKPVNERVEWIENVLVDLDKNVNEKIYRLYQENKNLKTLMGTLEKRIAHLEEQPRRKGLFK